MSIKIKGNIVVDDDKNIVGITSVTAESYYFSDGTAISSGGGGVGETISSFLLMGAEKNGNNI